MIITFGGKERTLKFNTIGLREAQKKMPLDGEELKFRAAMIWGGLKGNDYAKDQESDYTWEDVTEWVDELFLNKDEETIKNILAAMQESKAYQALLPKEETVTEEKKSRKKKLSESS